MKIQESTCSHSQLLSEEPAAGGDELSKIAGLMLHLVGENPKREGLLDTPKRFAKALRFLTSGYETSVRDAVGSAVFNEPGSELVLVRDIEFFSLCEHHMLPFFGKAHVAYIPDGRVIGLSKIPRIVDIYARRLQVQERLTREIAQEIDRILKPKGVMVHIEASHMCMMMRGVEKQNSSTITKATIGAFEKDATLRAEFLSLLKS
ncbi:MAG: GTP cyclohydrolase I FolE [Bdellovibrionia bacterium]